MALTSLGNTSAEGPCNHLSAILDTLEPTGFTSINRPPLLRKDTGKMLAGATRHVDPTTNATFPRWKRRSALRNVGVSSFSPKYVASGFNSPTPQARQVGAPRGAGGAPSPRQDSGEEDEDEEDRAEGGLGDEGLPLTAPSKGDVTGEGDDDELLPSPASCFFRIVETSGSACSMISPPSSNQPRRLKTSAAGHLARQRMHTARVSLPCSSTTRLLPAALCRPSTFCVTTPSKSPWASSSASARCPAFGLTLRSKRYNSSSKRQHAMGSRRKLLISETFFMSYLRHKPPGSRYVGTPLSALTPAPVKATTPPAAMSSAAASMSVSATCRPPGPATFGGSAATATFGELAVLRGLSLGARPATDTEAARCRSRRRRAGGARGGGRL
mmetsp:Transcript_93759/g.261021  ORF Transcript_93759/g.261021 Transcript_93759/m.261021 type:complete len:385 (+) Transcript_93759:196-1350(+)